MVGRLARLRAGFGRMVDATRPGTLAPYQGPVNRAADEESRVAELSDAELTAAAAAIRERTAERAADRKTSKAKSSKIRPDSAAGRAQEAKAAKAVGFTDAERVEWCALGREAARRALDLRPFDVQLLATVAMLSGEVVQMATGEGKTLVGALVAAGYATQGRQVHVISVNDYLAQRDAEWMAPCYRLLGVSVGWIGEQSSPAQRRAAYAADVTYVSVSEAGFDVLRDRLAVDRAEVLVPAPDVAVVDEADSVLVDEATVPLILAGAVTADTPDRAITKLVGSLRAEDHYEVDEEGRNVYLTEAGAQLVERAMGGIDLYTAEGGAILAQVNVSLHAHALLHRDVDYLVTDGKVRLINTSRGRVATLQRWPDGLQAAVELKESVAVSTSGEVLDSMTVQALLRRYRTVCGMSGTAAAVAEHLREFYDLGVRTAEPNVPFVREDEPDRVYATVAQKDAAIVAYLERTHATGRPILVGTLDVAESDRLAARLRKAGLSCVVLNARDDAGEAAIVAEAGAYGAITVSTQMAGRGTDIRLGGSSGSTDSDKVAEAGGLCVVGTGQHTSSRLDDQLRGRAGRQGDPGSSVFFVSIEDELVHQFAPETEPALAGEADSDGRMSGNRAAADLRHAQRVAEAVQLETHRNTWRYNQLVEQQRTILLRHRDKLLDTDLAATELKARCPERYTELAEDIEDEVLEKTARLIALGHLDRCWVDHLAFLAEIRETIHLHTLARADPLTEFHRIVIPAFEGMLAEAADKAEETFRTAEITADGVDLAAIGLNRPTATWTYLVQDNPFKIETENTLAAVSARLRRRKRST